MASAHAHEPLLVRLQDITTDLLSVTDFAGTVHYLNPAARRAYDLAPDTGIGLNIGDVLSSETIEVVLESARECRRTGSTVTTNLTIDGGANGSLCLATTISYDPESGLFYNVQRDVAGTLQNERSLEIAERFLSLTGDAVAMIDSTGTAIRTNQAFEDLFGVANDNVDLDLTGRTPDSEVTTLATALAALGPDHPRTAVDIEITTSGTTRVVSTLLQFDDTDGSRYLVARDVTDERRLRRQLEQRAGSDALTELANRASFIDALEKCRTDGVDVAVVLIDLDGFKDVNDAHGHATGDDLLTVVAARLRSNVRAYDIVARLGGDEFAVLATGNDPLTSATAIANQLRPSLAAPYEIDGTQLALSASIGVAATHAGNAGHPSAVLHEADAAMYTAKRTGRNKFVVFDQQLRAVTERRDELSRAIEAALASGQIDADVQALWNLELDCLTGAEALVRWDHPTHGRLLPADFIDLVIDKGLVMDLTRQVLFRAITSLGDMMRSNRAFALSINVSPRQLSDPELLRYFVEICEQHDIRPSQIIVEFTEERLIDAIERTAELLHGLRAAGFRIAIDDFGAGASSLAYFRLLPVDFVKLDRGLISHVPHDTTESMIVKAVADLAADLGFRVCAEGIESAEQAEWLRSINCRFGQGYHLHRPEPIESFVARWSTSDGSST